MPITTHGYRWSALALALGLVAAAIAPARGEGDTPRADGSGRAAAGTLAASPGAALKAAGPALEAAAAIAPLGPAFRDALFSEGARSGRVLDAVVVDVAARTRAAVVRWTEQGSGLPLATAPWVAVELKQLADEGGGSRGAADHVRRRLRLFARAANLGRLPDGLRPVYAETRHDGESEILDTRAFVASFQAQVEVAGALLRGTHQVAVAGRVESFLGDDSESGFHGLLALYLASVRLHAIGAALASNGRSVGACDLDGYDPFAAPGWLAADPKVALDGTRVRLSVAGNHSRLSDHARALLATVRFYEFGRPGGPLAPVFDEVTAGGVRERVFSADQVVLAKRTARFLYRNLIAFHFDPAPEHRTFVSVATGGAVGDSVRIADLGLGLAAISRVESLLVGDDILVEESRLVAGAVGAFVGRLLADYDVLPREVNLSPGSARLTPSAEEASSGDLAELASGLLAALEVSGDKKLERLLARVLARLEGRRFDPWVDLYLGSNPALPTTLRPTDGPRVLALLGQLAVKRSTPGAVIRLERVHAALVGIDALPSLDRGSVSPIVVSVKR